MNEELTKQLQRFLNQGRVATHEDLKEHLDFFIKLVKEVKSQLESKIKEDTDKQDKNVSSLVKYLDNSIKNTQKLIDSSNNKSKSKLESNYKELKLEIGRVEKLIPKIPNIPDVNLIEAKLISRINSIKSLTSEDFKKIILNNGITVRDSLERLKGEERLDKSAIRGIETIEEDIKKIKAQPAFKVINVGSSSSEDTSSGTWYQDEVVASGVTGTSFSLINTPASVVFLYLNGQYLISGVGRDYTRSGKNITLARTLLSTDILTANYS